MSTIQTVKAGEIISIDVTSQHPLYTEMLPIWKRNRAFCKGQDAVKKEGQEYLPKLGGQKAKDYTSYIMRAQCPNFAGRTRTAYKGMLFRKKPIFTYSKKNGKEVTSDEKKINDDYLKLITNDGLSATDFIDLVCEEVMTVNKAGVLVEFPYGGDFEIRSQKEFEESGLKPLASLYKAESIINWHTATVRGQKILTDAVLVEERFIRTETGLLSNTPVKTFRILILENYENPAERVYKQIVLTPTDYSSNSGTPYASATDLYVEEIIYPKNDGKYLDYIPFFVHTAQGMLYDNTETSLLHDLVNVNWGYYLNSANWENELYWVGAKTLYLPGWSKSDGTPHIGGAMTGPANTEPKMIEASSSSGIKDEMQSKQNHMAIMGSQNIAQEGRYFQSGETSKISSQSEDSILSTLANKISDISTRVFTLLFDWSGRDLKDFNVTVSINTDFYEDNLTGKELLDWMAVLQSNMFSYDMVYHNLEKKEAFPPDWDMEKEKQKVKESLQQVRESESLEVSSGISNEVLLEKYDELSQKYESLINGVKPKEKIIENSEEE